MEAYKISLKADNSELIPESPVLLLICASEQVMPAAGTKCDVSYTRAACLTLGRISWRFCLMYKPSLGLRF